MGDKDDLPFDLYEELESLGEGEISQRRIIQQAKLDIDEEEEMQHQSILQERIQPMEKLDKDIKEISKLMLMSSKEIVRNRWMMKRGYCSGKINGALQHNVWKPGGELALAAGQKQQQQQHGRGASEQLQSEVWDLRGY
jgi:hypothetical protein